MAGMLPGVEYARRRRLHQSSCSADPPSSTRRSSSFCLHRTGHETHLSSSSVQRNTFHNAIHDQALGEIAREAKERLDARLRIKRHGSLGSGKLKERESNGEEEVQNRMVGLGSVQREVFMTPNKKNKKKKKKIMRFSWSKMMGGKASDRQAECAVCLEEFKTGDVLIHLPCAHRFHWSCAAPWLESSSHCPCCRTTVTFK